MEKRLRTTAMLISLQRLMTLQCHTIAFMSFDESYIFENKQFFDILTQLTFFKLTPSSSGRNSLLKSFVRIVFYTSAIRNVFAFHRLPNIHFCEHFIIQISHNIRTINAQINIRGKKTWKIDTLAKLFHCILTRPSDNLKNLLKLEHQAGVKTKWMNYENSPVR